MKDKRFDQIDNPARQKERDKAMSITPVRPNPIWPGPEGTKEQWDARHKYDRECGVIARVRQEQEVVDKRSLIEEFAAMIEEYKSAGERLEAFAIENDIPGICGYEGYENWLHKDIVGESLAWAASNHDC